MAVTSRNWRQQLSVLEIIDYRRITNLMVSIINRKSPHFKISVTIEHSSCFIAPFQVVVIDYISVVATGENNAKLGKKFLDHLQKLTRI